MVPVATDEAGAALKEERTVANILMVDDHPANLLALEGILAPLGHNLVRAHSGEEALKAVLRLEFAVILMDVQMPGLDGFRTVQLIKERERSRHVPVIFLTAISREAAHVFKGYAYGAVDYMLKPFEPDILRSKVAVFVDLYLKGEQIKKQEQLLRAREREALERRSETRYRMLTDAVPIHMWEARPDGSIRYANRRMLDYLGAGAHALQPGELLEKVHPEDRPRFQSGLEESLAARKALQLEVRLQRAEDRSYRWHLVTLTVERDDTGEMVGWIGTATDIHEAKTSSEALERFQATLDATADAICILDPVTLELSWVNQGTIRQLGYSREELVGKKATELEPSLGDEALSRAVTAVRPGHPQVLETKLERKDGSTFPVEVLFQHVGVEHPRVVGIARDISERKRIEEALRLASAAKDEFLAAASHELRTPLQAAKGHAHLTLLKLGGEAESPVGRGLKTIGRQIDRMAQLVENLLDVSRLQAGKLSLELERIDLSEVLHDLVDRMRGISDQHPIQLELGKELTLVADRSRVEQVVTNLVSNAIRYSPHGGTVVIHAERQDDGVHVSVTDQGVGIPPEKQALIFERFGRAHGSRFGGLGLGLTISQGIIEQHGGRLWLARSEESRGSTFELSLPLQAHPPPRHA